MSYSQEDIRKIIKNCCFKLAEDQPTLFQEKHNINERAVSGALAGIMQNCFEGFHVNSEYNRMIDEHGTQIPKRINLDPNHNEPSNVFPDVIVHRQEDGLHNLLIVEIKMTWKNDKKEADFNKLTRYIEELSYQYGLYLELGQEVITEMEWFQS